MEDLFKLLLRSVICMLNSAYFLFQQFYWNMLCPSGQIKNWAFQAPTLPLHPQTFRHILCGEHLCISVGYILRVNPGSKMCTHVQL